MSDPTLPDRATRRAAVARRRRLVLLGGLAVLAIAAVVVVVLLATGGSDDQATVAPASTAAPGASTTQQGTAPATNAAKPLSTGVCSAQQLTGDRASSGIKGNSQVAVIALTNRSEQPCTLNGTPAIVIAGDAGGLPTVVTPGGGAISADLAAQEVTLAPGAQASFVASWAPLNGPGGGDGGCTKGTKLEVTPPAGKGTVAVDMLITACTGGALNVSPIQPGIVTA